MTYILKQRDHHLRHSVKTNIGLISKYYSIPKTITSIPTCPAKTSTRIPYFCEKNNLGSLFFFQGRGKRLLQVQRRACSQTHSTRTHLSRKQTHHGHHICHQKFSVPLSSISLSSHSCHTTSITSIMEKWSC